MADQEDQGQAVQVVDEPGRHRYEAHLGDRRVGLLVYRRHPDAVDLQHTEVDASAQGHGVAGALVARALADARSAGISVIPTCPYVAAYLRRHPEEADLVAD